MSGPYDDILSLPHPTSAKHPRMPALDRAAQFSPFAALTGHEAAIRETARRTDRRMELDESVKAELDRMLQLIGEHLPERPEVSITYFRADAKKSGGAYVSVTGGVKKIDVLQQAVILADGTQIPIDDIYEMECERLEPLI